MFIQSDIREFINKIINQSDMSIKNQVKENIIKFREYLRLTCMANEVTLADIDLIIDCLDELMVLKTKFGRVDVMSLFEGREKEERQITLKKTPQNKYDRKHYQHYSGGYASSCGTSSRTNSCGTSLSTYSSSCGSISTYRGC